MNASSICNIPGKACMPRWETLVQYSLLPRVPLRRNSSSSVPVIALLCCFQKPLTWAMLSWVYAEATTCMCLCSQKGLAILFPLCHCVQLYAARWLILLFPVIQFFHLLAHISVGPPGCLVCEPSILWVLGREWNQGWARLKPGGRTHSSMGGRCLVTSVMMCCLPECAWAKS